MDLPEQDGEELSHPAFWDARYRTADGEHPTHEWFKSYRELLPFLKAELFDLLGHASHETVSLLHLGAGDSTLPFDLLNEHGYTNQSCIDFSKVVIDLMHTRRAHDGITWIHGDVRNMPQIDSRSIDVAFDKGTLDAMIYGSPWSPPDRVKSDTGRYMREVARALKLDGVFLYVTFRQPHFVKPLLNQDGLWDLRMEVLGGAGGMFEYYGFVLKHATTSEHQL